MTKLYLLFMTYTIYKNMTWSMDLENLFRCEGNHDTATLLPAVLFFQDPVRNTDVAVYESSVASSDSNS